MVMTVSGNTACCGGTANTRTRRSGRAPEQCAGTRTTRPSWWNAALRLVSFCSASVNPSASRMRRTGSGCACAAACSSSTVMGSGRASVSQAPLTRATSCSSPSGRVHAAIWASESATLVKSSGAAGAKPRAGSSSVTSVRRQMSSLGWGQGSSACRASAWRRSSVSQAGSPSRLASWSMVVTSNGVVIGLSPEANRGSSPCRRGASAVRN